MTIKTLEEYINEYPKKESYYTPTFKGDFIKPYIEYLEENIKNANEYLKTTKAAFGIKETLFEVGDWLKMNDENIDSIIKLLENSKSSTWQSDKFATIERCISMLFTMLYGPDGMKKIDKVGYILLTMDGAMSYNEIINLSDDELTDLVKFCIKNRKYK